MTSRPPTPPAARHTQLTALRRRLRSDWVLVALLVTTVVLGVLSSLEQEWIDWFPLASLMLPLLVGSLILAPAVLPWFVVFVMVVLTVAATRQPTVTDTDAAAVAVYFVLGLVVLLLAFRRSRLGVAGLQGEAMFVDLRDRILNQGAVPRLPDGWRVESAIAPAGGTEFAGDFVVASSDPDRLDLVVVDVSGNGVQAATRALHLSGAFGGMIGAVPRERFLSAANDYLVRQDWEEGFATAVHLSVDLATGAFEVRTAGHPPPLLRTTSGWSALDSVGPVLGLIDGIDYEPVGGVLGPGEALLLYTDGVVERPRTDLEVGVDELKRAADAELGGGSDTAAQLVRILGTKGDDRAVVVVRRD